MAGSFPLTHREPRRHRDAGAQPAVLRAAARRAADLPRARDGGHARRHPARRPRVDQAGPALDRAGRQRRRRSSPSSTAPASPRWSASRSRSSTCRSADLREAAPRPRAADRRRRMTRVMISCGEPSGDLYAGALARALRERRPGVDVFGFGGPRLRGGRRAPGRRLPRAVGHRADRGAARPADDLRHPPAAGRGGARRRRPDVARPDRLSRFQLPPDARRCRAGHPDRLLRRRRRCGRGVPAA